MLWGDRNKAYRIAGLLWKKKGLQATMAKPPSLKPADRVKLIHKNKKAYFDYEIIEVFLAGLVLKGNEIKSIRMGNINLKGAYISPQGSGLVLRGAHIGRYPYDSDPAYDPFRDRPLLLSRKEIDKATGRISQQGITLVPLAIGLVGRYAKLELGLVRGKKKHDKRQSIKEKDEKRQIQRMIRSR